MKGKIKTFYQALIDSRDCPFIVSESGWLLKYTERLLISRLIVQRAQTEAVTFLGSQESNRSLYAIPGLDYVAHEDILPYTTTENHPLQHELFDKFLMVSPERSKLKSILIVHNDSGFALCRGVNMREHDTRVDFLGP